MSWQTHMKELIARTCWHPMDVTISRQMCRWPNLPRVVCPHIALNMDAIIHLSSSPNLTQLSFTAVPNDVSGSTLVFPHLADLHILATSLDTITSLLSHIQLPAAKTLAITLSSHVSKPAIQAFWAAAPEASPSIVAVHLDVDATSPGEDVRPQLTLEDLFFHSLFRAPHLACRPRLARVPHRR